ncbi:MAG: hypothetical protein EBX40_00625 [Gammaproteobacteria bacterium]|nr:hypothetical protein [Gammaproteobacteria bacterium]
MAQKQLHNPQKDNQALEAELLHWYQTTPFPVEELDGVKQTSLASLIAFAFSHESPAALGMAPTLYAAWATGREQPGMLTVLEVRKFLTAMSNRTYAEWCDWYGENTHRDYVTDMQLVTEVLEKFNTIVEPVVKSMQRKQQALNNITLPNSKIYR